MTRVSVGVGFIIENPDKIRNKVNKMGVDTMYDRRLHSLILTV